MRDVLHDAPCLRLPNGVQIQPANPSDGFTDEEIKDIVEFSGCCAGIERSANLLPGARETHSPNSEK